MSNPIVHGGTPLRGRVVPSANKNAVLPILCATLLTDQPLRLHGVPDITDVRKILDIFRTLGSEVQLDETTRTLQLHHRDTRFDASSHRLPEEMRSSIMLVPPLLARFGVARLEDNVKGCTLGVREIDPHVDIFRSFGGEVERASGSLLIHSAQPLKAVRHWLDYASVTATENFVLCAVAAQGESMLTNAACEPHVQEFCRFMVMMGADIDGIGTSRLTVRGGAPLRGGEFTFEEDFHEITTFLALGAITGGDVEVRNSTPDNVPLIDRTFAKFGVQVEHKNGWSRALRSGPLRCRRRSPAMCSPRSRLRRGRTFRWICCPSSLRWACMRRAMRCSGTRSTMARWAGRASCPSSVPMCFLRTRTAWSPLAAIR